MQVTGPGRVRGTVLVVLERASVRADDEEVTLSPGDALLSREPFDAQIVAGRVVVVTVTA
jgi:hypothetical protein